MNKGAEKVLVAMDRAETDRIEAGRTAADRTEAAVVLEYDIVGREKVRTFEL